MLRLCDCWNKPQNVQIVIIDISGMFNKKKIIGFKSKCVIYLPRKIPTLGYYTACPNNGRQTSNCRQWK